MALTPEQQAAIDAATARQNAIAAASARLNPPLGQAIGQYLGGIKQGIYDIPQSVAELGARGTDALGITSGGYDKLHGFLADMNRIANPGGYDNKYGQGGRVVGQIASTAPLTELAPLKAAGPVMGALARIGNGAIQGASAAGLTSNSSNAPLAQQVGTGAAFGAALPVVGAAARGIGNGAAHALGIPLGTSAKPIQEAFAAGLQGGDAGKAFLGNTNGTIPWDQVVTDAKSALANMYADRGAAYRSGMQDISKDKSILDFKPIDNAINKATAVKTFKGEDLSKSTTAVRGELQAAIDHWKSLDPAEYHTPEGIDALKQQIGDIKDAQPYGTPQARVANDVYGAIRQTIADQAPVYDKVMSNYSTASDALKTMEKELNLGPKGNPNTALRKLQSVMNNNVNTSWGDRAKFADVLAANGAPNLAPALAGQALSTWVPRGLARYADASILSPGGAARIAALPLASPRVVGTAAYGLGAAGRGVNSIPGLANILKNMSSLSAPSLGLLGGQFGTSLTPSVAY